MRELAVAGLIALAFGLGSYYATQEIGSFGLFNLGFGGLALLIAALGGARRMRGLGASAARGVMLRRLGVVMAALAVAVALEWVASASDVHLDWTLERQFELAPATLESFAALPDTLVATLYFEPFDARARRTRLLLDLLAHAGPVAVRERPLGEAPAEEERFGVTTANTVVLELGDRFERVERPTEGSILEAVLRLTRPRGRTLYLSVGAGEGDFGSADPAGYSGLRAALETEGFVLRGLVTAAAQAVPDDAAAVLVVGPRRALRPEARRALIAYLEGGGSLVAFLDPGTETGLEEVIGHFGLESPDELVVDLASGSVEGSPAGVSPVVNTYAEHPVTQGLSARTMSFFVQARPVRAVRKPEPDDRLQSVVFTSRRAWTTRDFQAVERDVVPEPPPQVDLTRFPLVSVGRYPRPGGEARVVVFGDSDLASNKYLRALYNLDLVMNAVLWAVQEESHITLRPKIRTPNQDPLTPAQALGMFYGVGLAVPELLLIAGAVAWSRRRSG